MNQIHLAEVNHTLNKHLRKLPIQEDLFGNMAKGQPNVCSVGVDGNSFHRRTALHVVSGAHLNKQSCGKRNALDRLSLSRERRCRCCTTARQLDLHSL